MRRKKSHRINQAKVSRSPKSCIAAGGVVLNSDAGTILLIKRNGVWDLPKGKLEEGESIPVCAVREVEEETGMTGLKIISSLCETYHEYKEEGKLIGKTTYWYLMNAENLQKQVLSPQTEEGITDLNWREIDRSSELLGYENLKDVVAAVKGRLA